MGRVDKAADTSPYRGRRAVLATMHGKEKAFAPVFSDRLGMDVTVPDGLDTDQLGTFSGEVPRRLGMRETAISKARMALARTGETLALANEGSFGPHPQVPFLAAGIERAVFVDTDRGIVIEESLIDDQPAFHHAEVTCFADLTPHLERMDFPRHRLIVTPAAGERCQETVFKGLADQDSLAAAIAAAAARSPDGRALVQSDMRAHMNPRRMDRLAILAQRLAMRIGTACPACNAPGYGHLRHEAGLPCEDCGAPTHALRFDVSGCGACGHEERLIRTGTPERASAGLCPLCNP